MTRTIVPLVVLVLFGGFTGVLLVEDGFPALIALVLRERLALQMLLDITIAIVLFLTWMIPDAKKRGIPAWPYVVTCLFLGSIGALAYLVHRGLKSRGAVTLEATQS